MAAVITASFLLTSAVVIMTPGPDLAFIARMVARHRRRRPALAASAGMITAGALQASAGFLGVTLLLHTMPDLLTVLRWLGACALLTFGLLAVRAAVRPVSANVETFQPGSARGAFWQGLACTGTNPKVGLFLVAFLPQFVPAGMAPGPAMALLGTVYLGMGLAWLMIWTCLLCRLSRTLFTPGMMRIVNLLVGMILVGFSVRLAIFST